MEVIKGLDDDALCSSAPELKIHGNRCKGRVTVRVSLAQGVECSFFTKQGSMGCAMVLL